MDRAALTQQLIAQEGLRLRLYVDSAGVASIGVGRNLEHTGITKDEALLLLEHDIVRVEQLLQQTFAWFGGLDAVRQDVLITLAFNLGLRGLLGFVQCLGALARTDYARAAAEMMASTWARQVGHRAVVLAEQMRTGTRAEPEGAAGATRPL
jgi:lysozyme